MAQKMSKALKKQKKDGISSRKKSNPNLSSLCLSSQHLSKHRLKKLNEDEGALEFASVDTSVDETVAEEPLKSNKMKRIYLPRKR